MGLASLHMNKLKCDKKVRFLIHPISSGPRCDIVPIRRIAIRFHS